MQRLGIVDSMHSARPSLSAWLSKHLDGEALAKMAEPWILGGLSVAIMLFLWGLQTIGPVERVAIMRFMAEFGAASIILAYVINYTHIIWAYRLAYQQDAKFIASHIPSLIIAPLATLGFAVASFALWQTPTSSMPFIAAVDSSVQCIGLKLNWTTYPTVGKLIFACLMFFQIAAASLHYSMQAYGVALQSAIEHKRPFTAHQKKFLSLNLYAMWAFNVSWGCAFLVAFNSSMFTYTPPMLPDCVRQLTCGIFVLTAVLFAISLRSGSGTVAPTTTLTDRCMRYIPVVSLWVWLQPFIQPFGYQAWIVPLGHAIQYLWYVGKVESRGFSPRAKQESGKRTLYLAVLTIGIAGIAYFCFRILPELVSNQLAIPTIPPGFFAVLAYIMLSTHHYSIDGVVWKDPNSRARQLLKGIS